MVQIADRMMLVIANRFDLRCQWIEIEFYILSLLIFIEVIAAPGIDVNNIRRKLFPSVTPYPRSNGSAFKLKKFY